MDTHEGKSSRRNEDVVSAVIPCRSRCSVETSHQIHHKLGWKAINIDAKHVIFRCDGICKDNPKYTVHTVGDPRNPLTRFRSPEAVDLLIPSFVLDNNSVGPQPKREVSIFGLNDNINHTFLSDMCQKTGSVIEVLVYKHPRTKKHLGMAYVVFQDVGKADSFVAKNSGTSVMGQIITCIVDPYAIEISRCYEEQAMEAAPIPRYLSRLDFDKLLKFRKAESESLLGRKCFFGILHRTSAQRPGDVMFMESKTEKQKQCAEDEAAFQPDKCKHPHMKPAKGHVENVQPSVASSSTPSSEHFSTPAASLANPSCPPALWPLAVAPRFSAPFHMNQHYQSSFGCYRSVSSLPVSQPGFSPVPPPSGILPPLPPPPLTPVTATGKPSFLPCSNVPPPPPPAPIATSYVWPQTKTPTSITPLALLPQGSVLINSKSTGPYSVPDVICQSVPSTSTSVYEEVAPMDPAPSKKTRGQEQRKEIFARISGRKRAAGKKKNKKEKRATSRI